MWHRVSLFLLARASKIVPGIDSWNQYSHPHHFNQNLRPYLVADFLWVNSYYDSSSGAELDEMTLRPVSASISARALPAILPPRRFFGDEAQDLLGQNSDHIHHRKTTTLPYPYPIHDELGCFQIIAFCLCYSFCLLF